MPRAIQATVEQTGATPISKTRGERYGDCGDVLKSQIFFTAEGWLLQQHSPGKVLNLMARETWI